MSYIDFLEEMQMNEGVFDKNIFKAIFLAGGPGSGKSYVTKKVTGGLGMKVVNSDDIFEKFLKDKGLKTTPEDIFSDKGQDIRTKAKATTKTMQGNYLNGRLGIIIDGTGKDYEKIKKQRAKLEELGYDTGMIFVNTSLDVAQERNQQRERTLPEDQVEKMWTGVQQNMGKFQGLFGSSNMIIVDGNDANDEKYVGVTKQLNKIIAKPVKNHIAKKWIKAEMDKKKAK